MRKKIISIVLATSLLICGSTNGLHTVSAEEVVTGAAITSEGAVSVQKAPVAEFQQDTVELYVGQSKKNKLKISGNYEAIKWSVTDPELVKISKDGNVTLKKAGAGKKCKVCATIYYTREDGNHEKSVHYFVQGQSLLKKLAVTAKKNYVFVGKVMKLQLESNPSNVSPKLIEWVSSNENYATITQKGKIHPKKAGAGKTVIFTAKAKDGSGIKAQTAIRVIDLKKPMVALTFDDGPSEAYTKRILAKLKAYDARATFFVLGSRIGSDSIKKLIKESSDYGNEIGSHTYSHSNLAQLSAASIQQEAKNTESRIYNITGVKVAVTRPPYGSYSSTVSSNIHTPLILWSIDTRDWQTRNAASTVQKVLSGVKNGDIVLMHDIYDATASAAEQIIPALANRGYQMVTVSELATYKKAALKAGKAYSAIR